MTDAIVTDASVLIDLLAGTSHAGAVAARLRGMELHAPAHFDAEVLSALGRLNRAGALSDVAVEEALKRLSKLPITRHVSVDLLAGAWEHRASVRLVDALYVSLAEQLGMPLVTTDQRLARAWPGAEAIEGDAAH
jgi:predicted nucleic acid-binding protein